MLESRRLVVGAPRTAVTVMVMAIAIGAVGGRSAVTTEAFAAPAAQAASVLGTIEATVDGTARTWYVVGGKSGGRDYTSGGWIEPSPGERIVTVGGFDTRTPPLESFGWDPSGTPTSFGSYRGSVLNLVITVTGGATSVELSFPPSNPAVIYMPTASLSDMSSAFAIDTGTLHVTQVSFTGGKASAEGTFSGALRTLAGENRLPVSGGRFSVTGLPSLVR